MIWKKHGPKAYKFIGFGDIHGQKANKFIVFAPYWRFDSVFALERERDRERERKRHREREREREAARTRERERETRRERERERERRREKQRESSMYLSCGHLFSRGIHGTKAYQFIGFGDIPHSV